MSQPTPTPTPEECIAALEARVAELERRLREIDPEPETYLGQVMRRAQRASRETGEAEIAEFYRRIGADIPPIGAAALRQLQIDEGADPNSTAAREEIERMRWE